MTVSAASDWPWAVHRALAVAAECYETPEWAVEAILDVEMMSARVIDPCCGRGVLAEAAAERGHRVDAFDLYDWGYGSSPVDFLTWRFTDGDTRTLQPAPWTCLMNPPFTQAVAFAEHALAQGANKVMLFQRLAGLGIEVVTHRHPPVATVEQAQAHCAHLPGGHCKNLLLRDKKKRTYLLVAQDERPVDLKTLPDKIGAGRLSFASADRLLQYLGVTPGSVTPFALINDPDLEVAVFLDRAMMAEHELLNFHPLQNTMTTAITPADLLAFIAACGHTATLVDL